MPEATNTAADGSPDRSTRYATFAQDAEEERQGITLRDAFIRLLVLLWQDNEPDEVLALWRTLAQRPGPFTTDALAVLDAVIADPPEDLVELRRTHGWLPGHDAGPSGEGAPYTHGDAVAWLEEMRSQLQAIHDAEHPRPT
jgi:hypothetical protein